MSKSKKAKTAKPKDKKSRQDGTMSGLDAAVKVLSAAEEPLTTRIIVDRAFGMGLWKSKGKTPHATMFAAILREIKKKGPESRFIKSSRGKFALKP